MAIFAERLRSLIREKKSTLEEIANYVGTTKSTLSRYQNGKREPKAEIVNKLSDFFDVSADYILGKTDNKELNKNKRLEPKKPRDLIKILEEEDYTLNGRMASPEDRERLKQIYEIMFWDAKAQNKRKK